jgi:long-subunit fatty acid transport protein
MWHPRAKRSDFLAAFVAALLVSGPLVCGLGADEALAGGFEIPDNGAKALSRGAAFSVRADDLTAIAHNPAGLTRLRGWNLLYSHTVIHAPMTFTRAASGVPQSSAPEPGSPEPLAPVSNETPIFALGGMAVVGYGMEDWSFALGVYGPNAAGAQRWPVTGGQRWMLVELEALIVYPSLSVAYGKTDKWGVGVTLQAAIQPSTKLSLVVDGTLGGKQSPYYSETDVLATLSLSAPPAPTAIVGAWLRPTPWLEFGVSGRVMPIVLSSSGRVDLSNTEGGSKFTEAQLAVEGSAARLELVIPPTARAGVRYRGLEGEVERFDVELNVVYEAWSMMDQYKVELDGLIKLFAAHEAPDVIIDKRWRDTISVRLGGTYNLANLPLSLSGGAFYESAAVPNAYTHLDFPSFERLGLGAGVTGRTGIVDWTVAYAHVFQETRVVDELHGKVFQQRPISECPDGCDGYDAIPANAGTYESSYNLLSLSASLRF